ALWLIKNVFSKIRQAVVIAGLNPPAHLIEEIKKYSHITLRQNCSEQEMQSLIEDAQIHCLYTEQATGLKLKLLNVLFSGRFVIANTKMLVGTSLTEACIIANTPQQYIDSINKLFTDEFTDEEIGNRKIIIASINNQEKPKKIIELFS
ncbi:MAG: glycosyltransferase, partial [bacterium]